MTANWQGKAVQLLEHEAVALKLTARSYFLPRGLTQYLSEYPDLVFHIPGLNEYAVGGFWRRRTEIGMVLEMEGRVGRASLVDALIDSYRRRECALVVLDPREQERHQRFYRQYGMSTVQTLVQFERRGLDVKESAKPLAIRTMMDDDVAAVLEVERHSFPWLWWNSEAELLWYSAVPGVELFVAEAAERPGEVVAYVGFTVYGRDAHLDRLAVHRDYQHQGYGAGLLAFAMRRMAAAGARRVALTTQADNWQSHALYRAFGFRESGWRHDILGLWLRQPKVEG